MPCAGQHFVDNEPASFVIFATNFQATNQTFTAAWTLTDFEGLVTTGSSTFTLVPGSRQTVPLTINAPAMGHYRLKVDILHDGVRVEQLVAQLARIASRDTSERRYSPFAMCLTGEFELMKLAGVKSHRGDSASWGNTSSLSTVCFIPIALSTYARRASRLIGRSASRRNPTEIRPWAGHFPSPPRQPAISRQSNRCVIPARSSTRSSELPAKFKASARSHRRGTKCPPLSTTNSAYYYDRTRFRPRCSFEMEITVCNYYRRGISGTVSPRLPVGLG
jgi:hypothetical protein